MIHTFDLPTSLVSFISPLISLYTKWIILFLGWTGVLLDIPNVRADACVAEILFEVSSAPLGAIAVAQFAKRCLSNNAQGLD